MSTQSEDSPESGPAAGAGPVSRSGVSSASPLPRSPAGEVASQLAGAGVSLWCAGKAAALLSCSDGTPGPLSLPRWMWGLAALVLIAVPSSAFQLRRIVQTVLGARNGSR
jgi:hypothetical protein